MSSGGDGRAGALEAMDGPALQRLERIFQDAVDLPPDERGAFLARECAGDDALRARVDAMLRDDERDDSLAGPEPLTEGPGTVIGRYKLLQRIGEGGFGVVYMAEQTEPVRRKVALKIIKLGMDTKEVVARFEAERQALAMMEHPGIAKVLDGGATETGRPYFVMELVRGVAITEYCDTNNLSTRERLLLFQQVCQAVQHAHQKGVIHRDIKPTNVLVTLHDGVAVPKVIDFGIAKAMHARLTERTLFTAYQRFIGTPAYMSPEQAEMSGLDVDTRTDIYSLGVLLYELLTGSTPFDTNELLRAGLGEIQRVIREQPPQRPSLRISTSGDQAIAARRGVDAAALARRVRGDLDWIVMRALEKDRTRRYGTASEFAADVERHLANEPVLAGPPSAGYRARKFIARNRGAVVSVALIALALIAAHVGMRMALVRERAARQEALYQSDLARHETERAGLVTDFVVETLALADPANVLDPDVSVRTLLDRTVERIGDTFAEHPVAESQVRAAIGRAYLSLNLYEQSATQLREAVALADEAGGLAPLEQFELLWDLTDSLFAISAEDCYALATRALVVGQRHVASAYPELGASMARYMELVFDFDEGAVEEFQRCVALAEARLPEDDERWAILSYTFMAGGYSWWYSPLDPKAGAFFREASDILRGILPPNHPDVATALTHEVGVLVRSGRAAEAEERIRESIALLASVYPDDNATLAYSRATLGEVLTEQGRFEEAEELLLESHAIFERSFEPAEFHRIDSVARLCSLYDAWGREEDAERYRLEAARACATTEWPPGWGFTRSLFGARHAPLVGRLDRIGAACDPFTSAPDARPLPDDLPGLVGEALALRREWWPDDHPITGALGRVLLGWAEAAPDDAGGPVRRMLVEEALLALRPWREHVPLDFAAALAQLAEEVRVAGDPGRAAELAAEAWAITRESPGDDHWISASLRLRVGRAFIGLGQYERAESLVRPAHAIFAAQVGERHSQTRNAAELLERIESGRGAALPQETPR